MLQHKAFFNLAFAPRAACSACAQNLAGDDVAQIGGSVSLANNRG